MSCKRCALSEPPKLLSHRIPGSSSWPSVALRLEDVSFQSRSASWAEGKPASVRLRRMGATVRIALLRDHGRSEGMRAAAVGAAAAGCSQRPFCEPAHLRGFQASNRFNEAQQYGGLAWPNMIS